MVPWRLLVSVVASVVLAVGLAMAPPAAPASAATGYVGSALKPDDSGHWLTTSTGVVSASGTATHKGDLRNVALNQPIVGMTSTATGNGYWLVASDGGVFSFGDARFFGSTGSIRLNQPIVGMSAAPSGGGYWLVASDGGIFAFGNAGFFGSTGSIRLNQPIVGMSATASGNGYWLVASDGGIFAFGNAGFFGSTGSIRLNEPITAMSSTGSGNGYWMVASDGGIFAFGDAEFFGSGASQRAARSIGVLRNAAGGYSMVRADGSVMHTGPDISLGGPPPAPAPPVTSPPVTAPPANQQPAGPSGNWTLKFQDDFGGSSLDDSKWLPCYIWRPNGCTNGGNNELQWYKRDNLSVDNGALHMTAKREYAFGEGKAFNYTSGMVSSGPDLTRPGTPAKFEFQYGYTEARVKVPKGKGLWPAVWLLPSTGRWPPEIDIMEIIGSETDRTHMTYHWSANGQHRNSGGSWRGPDFSAGYHTFGVDWQPGHIRWYVDGVERRAAFYDTNAIPHEKMYVVMNPAVGGNWPGAPDSNTQFPSSYDVDWVRVWQK